MGKIVDMKRIVLALVLMLSILPGCATFPQAELSPNALNSKASQDKPYVVLVSLDGFRADYLDWYSPPFLNQMKAEGVSAAYMKSTYPSKTFPNHLSIVTGLNAENHGIVNNVFYDPQREQDFRASTPVCARDGSWFAGTPLWVAAEKQKMRSAVYFWPGSEPDIEGVRPSYYFHYDKKVSVDERVHQVRRWLALPPEERPHFLAIYFSDVDSAGHHFGPKSDEVKKAVLKVDSAVAEISKVIDKTGLPVNLVIVSDHGMEELDSKKVVYLEDLISLDEMKAVGDGTHVHLYMKNPRALERTYQALKKKNSSAFRFYKRSEIPQKHHYSKNPRIGDLLIEARDNFTVFRSRQKVEMEHGNHGYDPESPAMRAIFMAKGPGMQSHLKVDPFQNIEVYPFVMNLLQLENHQKVDARGDALKRVLIPKQSH
jgi:predicted AlkP superfamily pyrophosphatase or phosphodiesterase